MILIRTAIIAATVATTVATTLATSTLAAQTIKSNTTGFFGNVHFSGTSLGFDDEDSENGGGLGIQLGWGFNRHFTLFLGANGSVIDLNVDGLSDEYALGHFDIGTRVHFRSPAAQVVPYGLLAFSGRAAGTQIEDTQFGDVDVEISGTGFTFGGGVQVFFNPKVALDLGLAITAGSFTEFKVDGDTFDDDFSEKATSARLNVGLSFWPVLRGTR
jgi:opacity protein-like surface antigen